MKDSANAGAVAGAAGEELRIRPYAAGPPWEFRGRALYQLHLVKADVARKVIPKELKLVEAFGHTLGGFFLAHYDDSPAGAFDEAVIIPGIVWNPPASCAWAGRVLVGSEEARDHGRKEVGLPSLAADFTYSARQVAKPPSPWWDVSSLLDKNVKIASLSRTSLDIVQKDRGESLPLCTMDGLPGNLMVSNVEGKKEKWTGPSVQLYLPNFSGKTREQPNLLKYSCRLNCRVSAVSPVRIVAPLANENSSEETKDILEVLTGKALVSIFFDRMNMSVEAPKVVDVKRLDQLQQAAQSSRPVPTAPSASAS
ncbi:hypothetical protein R1flu_021899 [Riccia fluitans]|uniref:Acetoacetate decarboxylase n=1 Tax=Riccia fluitans TaxID=41844 RepID=A0ABD1ZSE4_9MARC